MYSQTVDSKDSNSCARSYLRVVSDWSRQSLQMEAPVHSTRTGKQCKPPLFVASRQRSRALPVLLDGFEVTHAHAATRVCVVGHMSAAVAALGSWREEGATVVSGLMMRCAAKNRISFQNKRNVTFPPSCIERPRVVCAPRGGFGRSRMLPPKTRRRAPRDLIPAVGASASAAMQG